MSPVWEANHVWLIFVLVMLWTAFPEAFGSITSTLAIPLFLAALGIVLRGGAFALKGEAATIAEARALGATFALSSVLVPFFLGASAGAIAAGEVPARQRGRRRVGQAGRGRFRSSSACWPWSPERTWRPSFSAPTRAERGGRQLVRAFRARALGSGTRGGRARDRGARRGELGGARPVRRAHLRRRPGLCDRVRPGGARRPSRSSGASASRSRATPPRPRWPRSSPAGHSPRSRTCCRLT